MLYKMITAARDRWYKAPACTVHSLIDYIEHSGQMRDAQVEAIKTYLFLKIGCGNAPLSVLFRGPARKKQQSQAVSNVSA